MKVGIIGAGFGGLAAAYKLAKAGIDVTIFETDSSPGGMAVGFKQPNWDWTLEKHYHHWFASDWSVRSLAEEVNQEVLFVKPKTSTFLKGNICQLDSLTSLLSFSELSFPDRLRMGAILAYLKITPFWEPLENVKAREFIKKYMGEGTWKVVWEPLFQGKFNEYIDEISAAWFWARVKKRSRFLGYPFGGYLNFAQRLSDEIVKLDGKVFYKKPVVSVYKDKNGLTVATQEGKFNFDKVICTLNSPLFIKIVKNLPLDYVRKLMNLKGIGAINLILRLKRQFLKDDTYWLNINEKGCPFISLVEHTNFMDKRYYANEHIIYVGNYLPHNHEYYKKNEDELSFEFLPYLRQINHEFSEKDIIGKHLFKAYFAQPIFPLGYSRIIPSFETPISGLYLSNIQQVYPWDRGTNYAVELGEKVANMIIKS